MRRRLLYLLNEALFFTTHRMPLALAARDAGFEVHVAAPDDGDKARVIEAAGFAFHPIPLDRGARGPLGELRLFLAIALLISRLRPHMVHHVSMKPVLWGGLASRLLRVPAAVFAVTGLGYLFVRDDAAARLIQKLLTPALRLALHHRNSRTIFQNPDDRRLLVGKGMVDAARCVTIRGCGVDLERFRPAPEPEVAPGKPPVVMFPARIIGDKGVNEFVAAARQLRGEGLAARFVLVGRLDPANPTAIAEGRVRQWTDEGVVEWWGYSTDMPDAFARAHVVVMPSYREGLPLVLAEAAAAGRPIVTTDVTGCREVVRDGVNGLLAPLRDAAATASAIRRLVVDAALRRRMGDAGRAIAEAEFSQSSFIADSMAVYRTLLPAGALP
jgi:glycosyltransferase involved in cell wall biosynthesis